jgi:crotonobetainyl-CoA:carnitine CoA-transferase CaiB-like acyl-CoA transferase
MDALSGIRVLDAATLFAGPLAAAILGDFGADVIKIEHPKGDPVRTHGPQKDGVPLWWKVISRNKQAITLNLSSEEGQEIFRQLVRQADVVIESFRPGTLERWNLGPEELKRVNPQLILTRISGFGQFGPYKSRPGFGTLAEAMSGFAAMTGEPDGPPTLPPFGLADGIAGLAAAIATLAALRVKEQTGNGQVVDVSLIEPILTILGAQPTWFDQLGLVQERRGNGSSNNAPRNTYRTGDGKWVAISTSAQNIAERVMHLVGHPEVIGETWFKSGKERANHAQELDEMVGGWIRQRPIAEVIAEFETAEAAIAPIYDIRDVMTDPQYTALDSITSIEDDELGSLKLQNVMFRLSETPGMIRWAGRRKGQDNAAFYAKTLGIDQSALIRLAEKGVI